LRLLFELNFGLLLFLFLQIQSYDHAYILINIFLIMHHVVFYLYHLSNIFKKICYLDDPKYSHVERTTI
jgi:hypothetical protein